MKFNSKLFIKVIYASLFSSKKLGVRLTHRRIIFLTIFSVVWPLAMCIHWLCFFLDDILFPGYKQIKIIKPLFIIGNPRSGSTFLHRVIASDPAFTCFSTWDVFIAPSVIQKKFYRIVANLDSKYGKNILHSVARWLDSHTLQRLQKHPTSFFKPEEDENVHLLQWESYFISVLFPYKSLLSKYAFFDDALSATHKKRILTFYRAMLQRHMYATGKQYFVAKSPSFSAKIQTISEYFPDARFVYLVRDPSYMLPSTIEWISYARSQFTGVVSHDITAEILEVTKYWYSHPLEFIDTHHSNSNHILTYESLTSKSESVITNLYKNLGYTKPDNLHASVVSQINDHNRFKKREGSKRSKFQTKVIEREYPDIVSRFNY